MKFPALFQPIQVGHLRLKHRIIMGSMHTGLEDQAQGFEKLARFYGERVREGVDLIVTGGFGTSPEALGMPERARYSSLYLPEQVASHRQITQTVHDGGGHILLQLLHVGRYDCGKGSVAPSSVPSPLGRLNNRSPRGLTHEQIEQIIADYIRCAHLAQQAGYDGVEIMGGEGYLINQFLAPATNLRHDQWGGNAQARNRFALRIVQGIRQAIPSDFVLSFRLSLMDLVEDGMHWSEVLELAQQLEAAGVNLFTTSVGWHEARVPTVAMAVPRAAFSWAAQQLKETVGIPVAASNRINMPQVAEQIVASGQADMVAMARPFLADPAWVHKAQAGNEQAINTCTACNQSCLDHIFTRQPVTCMINPRACHEREWSQAPATPPRRIAVLGAGPAGLACAREAAQRGHAVTVFERRPHLGGQLSLAKSIPGKEEFAETLRYFQHEMTRLGIVLRLACQPSVQELQDFDHVVVATGVVPRRSNITGENNAKVMDYVEAIRSPGYIGSRVAVVGGGPIGFDIAQLLSHPPSAGNDSITTFQQEWGVDPQRLQRGGVTKPQANIPQREIWLLQRSKSLPGSTLAATTGWVQRKRMKARGVRQFNDLEYIQIDDNGLHLEIRGERRCLSVDTIVICAGQQAHDPWSAKLLAHSIAHTVIGGARDANKIDAARAIKEGAELGRQL